MIRAKYSISTDKLLKKQTIRSKVQGTNSDKLVDEHRTFFCSELVAKAFKVLGIIEDDDTSCT